MNKGSVSVKVMAAAAGSLLLAGCGGTAAGEEKAPAQVSQGMRWDAANPSVRPELATGRFHNVALKADGSVWGWGLNTNKQLGDGTTTNRTQPVQVQGLTGTFVSVAAGGYHSLALRDDGTLWAWGANGNGQLGDGTSGGDKAPVQVQNLFNVVAMAGGAGFSLGLESDGDVWAWGHNYYCQLGNSSYNPSGLPVRVTTADPALPYLTNVVAIAAGQFSGLAVRGDGSVWAWGNNAHGRLGDGTTTERCRAVKIALPDGAVAVDVSMGDNHSLALLSNGTVLAWGHNGHGQLGTGGSGGVPSPASSLTPLAIPGLSNVTQIDAGAYVSLAVSNGVFFAWGNHTYGQLCSGSGGGYSNSMSPVPVSPGPSASLLPAFEYVGAGEYFSVAMGSDGTLWSCGFDGYGSLGYDIPGGSMTNTLTQVPAFP